MKKIVFLPSVVAVCILLIAANHHKHINAEPAVTISTTSLDITSANGVTMKYISRGYEATNLSSVDHGSCLNTTPNPEVNKDGSVKSKGVASAIDPKGKAALAGIFFCAAFTNNLKTGVKYYAKPYIKLSDGTIIYGSEKSVTIK